MKRNKFCKTLHSPLDVKEGAQKAFVKYWSLRQPSHPLEDGRTYVRQHLKVTHNFPVLLSRMAKYLHHYTHSFPPDVWAVLLRKMYRNYNSNKTINLLESYLPLNKFLLIILFPFWPFSMSPVTPVNNLLLVQYQISSTWYCNIKTIPIKLSHSMTPFYQLTSLFRLNCQRFLRSTPSSSFCNAHNLLALLQQIFLSHISVNNYLMPYILLLKS